jgi:hypothetical protein
MPTTPSVTLSQDIINIFKITSNTLGTQGGSLKVTFTPEAARSYTGRITITGGGVTKTVSLTGTGKGSPYLNLTPESLTFKDVNVNTTSTGQKVTIKCSNLTGNVTISPSVNFSINPRTTTITAAQAAAGYDVYVYFNAPAIKGTYNGTLTVSSGTVKKTVSLTGIAMPEGVSPY